LSFERRCKARQYVYAGGMAKRTKAKNPQEIVERVQKLVALAADGDSENGTEEERTAALKAVRMIAQHELSIVNESEMENAKKLIGQARELAAKFKEEKNNSMLMGGLIGYFLGGR
jgi:hypothetical protein